MSKGTKKKPKEKTPPQSLLPNSELSLSTHTVQKPTGYLQLIRQNANFRNLWLGQVISLMGDWFNLIASASLVAHLTQSGLAVGGLFVARMLAQFFMGPFGGALADRFDRKRLLVVTDFARAVIVLGFLRIGWGLLAAKRTQTAHPQVTTTLPE